MEIYVGKIPPSTTVEDLQYFFREFQKDATFEIVWIQGEDGEHVFGHVVIPHERRARKAIRRLNLQHLNHHRVVVREFQRRAVINERRALNWRSVPWQHKERRQAERRVHRERMTTPFRHPDSGDI